MEIPDPGGVFEPDWWLLSVAVLCVDEGGNIDAKMEETAAGSVTDSPDGGSDIDVMLVSGGIEAMGVVGVVTMPDGAKVVGPSSPPLELPVGGWLPGAPLVGEGMEVWVSVGGTMIGGKPLEDAPILGAPPAEVVSDPGAPLVGDGLEVWVSVGGTMIGGRPLEDAPVPGAPPVEVVSDPGSPIEILVGTPGRVVGKVGIMPP